MRGDFHAYDFWSLIHYCRNGATDHERPTHLPPYYDLVYGQVAAFWNQRMSIADADQVSFHTAAAEAVLNKGARKRIILGTVQASTASHFWAAVEDCLVNFHHFERDKAAEKVTTLWRQLPKGTDARCDEPSFEDMIYHAEPWYIACNLAERDLSLTQYQSEYRNVLRENQLA